jgi:hypothetical protein
VYISREIDNVLSGWKNEKRRKPLLLRGVRQCGKTSAVRKLGETFESYVEINFEKQPNICDIFEGDINIKKLVGRLELQMSQKIIPGKTLLFIDEIQECPRAITTLRYFYEDMPELHVIAAGSLLEFVLSGKEALDFPVGRVRSVFLYPFSFMEFLKGTGEEILYDFLMNINEWKEENPAHSRLLEIYKTFLVVGGMPEAVAEYASSGSLLECQQIHRDIVLNFMDDFNKYSPHVPADMIRRVFEYALHNVCGQTKASSAVEGISTYYFDESINLLRKAGLVYPVKATPCKNLPLGASEKNANKKLLVFDTGVYLTVCGLNVGELLSAEIFSDLNKGNVVEMQTGLEMIKYSSPYTEAKVYYWYRSGANAEVDYVITENNTIIPVEVKAAGKGRMQSIRSFLDTVDMSEYGIRVSMENFSRYDDIYVYPVYAVSKFCSGQMLNNKNDI